MIGKTVEVVINEDGGAGPVFVSTGLANQIRVRAPGLYLCLMDAGGEVLAGEVVEVTLPDGEILSGTTDPEGKVRWQHGLGQGKATVRLPGRNEADWTLMPAEP